MNKTFYFTLLFVVFAITAYATSNTSKAEGKNASQNLRFQKSNATRHHGKHDQSKWAKNYTKKNKGKFHSSKTFNRTEFIAKMKEAFAKNESLKGKSFFKKFMQMRKRRMNRKNSSGTNEKRHSKRKTRKASKNHTKKT
jgi:hypothetical protein